MQETKKISSIPEQQASGNTVMTLGEEREERREEEEGRGKGKEEGEGSFWPNLKISTATCSIPYCFEIWEPALIPETTQIVLLSGKFLLIFTGVILQHKFQHFHTDAILAVFYLNYQVESLPHFEVSIMLEKKPFYHFMSACLVKGASAHLVFSTSRTLEIKDIEVKCCFSRYIQQKLELRKDDLSAHRAKATGPEEPE